MQKKGCFKFGWLIFRRKETVLPVLLLAFGIYGLFNSADAFYNLLIARSEPVNLICTVDGAEDKGSGLEKIEGVGYVTRYTMGTAKVSIGEYSQTITVYGMEENYLSMRYGNDLAVPISSAMPYIIMDIGALESLKNSKGDSLKVAQAGEYLLETVKVGDENSRDARICGIIGDDDSALEETKESAKNHFIYTTLEGFEQLMDTGEEDELAPSETYLVLTDNGKDIEEVKESIENYGFVVQMPDMLEDQVQTWKEQGEKGKYQLYNGIILCLCAGMIFLYQRRLYKREHQDFIIYVNSIERTKKSTVRMYRYSCIYLIVSGFIIGSLLYWICYHL